MLSTGLYVQMLGRGTRKHTGKSDCLVLDFAGNVKRHGFVDAVKPNVQEFEIVGGNGTGRRRLCVVCGTANSLLARWCKNCGHHFKRPHDGQAATTPLLQRGGTWRDVDGFTLDLHTKKENGSRSLRVRYYSGPHIFDEYLTLEHGGAAREIAIGKWASLGGKLPAPGTVEEALRRKRELCSYVQIYLQRDGQYHNVIGRRPRSAPQADGR